MESTWLFGAVISVGIILLTLKLRRRVNIPPYPALPLPIVGHFHLLKHPIQKKLQEFAKKFGPVISLKLGSRLVVVVSSPSAVEECFTKNDITFSNRPSTLVGKYIAYNNTSIVTASYGEHWRNLRRLTSEDLVSPSRLKYFQSIRQDEIKHLLQGIHDASNGRFVKVDMRSRLSELNFNIIMRIVAGKKYFGEANIVEERKFFQKLAKNMFEYVEAFYPEDFIPMLHWIDLRGIKKKLIKFGQELDSFFQDLVEEHRREERNTMIGHLLKLQETDPGYYTDQIIKGLILVLILAGTDTTTVIMEWTMALLLNNPQVLRKAREEVELKIGDDRLVNEEDIPKLHYIQAIVSEGLRFGSGPILLPHEASKDCTLQGYNIPRGTMLLINQWAIHMNPTFWEDPTSFKPERFLGKEIDPFALVAFGKGRRACPGSGLAHRVLSLTLASLIHCFEWERTTTHKIKLEGVKGLNMALVDPLEALCKSRQFVTKLLPDSSY